MRPIVKTPFRVSFAFLALCCLTIQRPAIAHNPFEIDVTGGYRFGSKVELSSRDDEGTIVSQGDFRVDGSFAFSAIAGYRIQPDGFIYLSYSRQQTNATYSDNTNGSTDFSGRSSLEYYQFGGNVEMTRGIFVPYLGFSLGLGRLAALGGDSSRVYFAPVFDSGVKIDLHENIHLRFLGRIPVLFMSGDVFCPSGATCLESDQIKPMAQVEIHGGVGVSF